ncbi:Rieske (2Fe-2S) protein [Acidobacteria bacterium ACD]|nr:MAG: Rieske (2Fe-2S) protein [Acidobacteriota bacterium]MDL1950901.1 Rieske (2Fe-2S) protein [Acidobacteria bacterium ACD]
MRAGSPPRGLDRRRLVTGLAALAALPCLARCSRAPAGPPASPSAEVPLAKLPPGTRVVLPVGHQPVEFLREGDSVTARSLACTHQGCEVVWVEEERTYHCPCHDGRFDSEGNVLAGPPARPLRAVPVERKGDVVLARLPAA